MASDYKSLDRCPVFEHVIHLVDSHCAHAESYSSSFDQVDRAKEELQRRDRNTSGWLVKVREGVIDSQADLAPEMEHAKRSGPDGVVEDFVVVVSDTVPDPVAIMIHPQNTFTCENISKTNAFHDKTRIIPKTTEWWALLGLQLLHKVQ